jgi:uncharacterized protein (DUF2235 family)
LQAGETMALYAFDGTWNNANTEPESKNTNVYRFGRLYAEAGEQKVFYWPGPGSRFGKVGYWLGGLAGLGTRWRLSQALAAVYDQYCAGDKVIDIVGFSRGAATAVAVASVLNIVG